MSVDAARGWGSGPGSSTVTSNPRRARAIAPVMPKSPAPTTTTLDLAICLPDRRRCRNAFAQVLNRARASSRPGGLDPAPLGGLQLGHLLLRRLHAQERLSERF